MTGYENLKRTLTNEEIQALIKQENQERKILRSIKIPTDKRKYLKREGLDDKPDKPLNTPKYSPNSMWFYEDD